MLVMDNRYRNILVDFIKLYLWKQAKNVKIKGKNGNQDKEQCNGEDNDDDDGQGLLLYRWAMLGVVDYFVSEGKPAKKNKAKNTHK